MSEDDLLAAMMPVVRCLEALDVQGVLKVQRELLDRDYLWKWACELGVADLLEEALKEAGVE